MPQGPQQTMDCIHLRACGRALLLLAMSLHLLGLTDAVRVSEHSDVHGDARGAEGAGWTSGRTQRRLTRSERSNDVGLQELTPAPHPPHTAGVVAAGGARQQLLQDDRGWETGGRTGHTNTRSSSRRLQQFGPIYAEVPGDLTGLASILAAARDAFTFFEPDMFPPPVRQQRTPRSRALGGSGNRNTAQQGDFSLLIAFKSANPDADVALRLPGALRSFNVTALYMAGPGPQQPCTHTRVPYAAQELTCGGMSPGSKWQVSLVDADADDLVLLTANFTVSADTASHEFLVELGLLSVEAAFDQLAWAGMYYPHPRHSTSTIVIHAQIVGAQVVIYTRQGGKEVLWDVQWTGSEGTTTFFLLPGVRNVYYANMSVGETVLRTTPITLDEPLFYQDAGNGVESVAQLQQQQLIAVPQLLCTGEVEDVRGSAGTFPQSLTPLEARQQSIYHPRGFACRWELTPDQSDVLLSVDYRGLLPDESITLELAPNNIVRLTPPADGSPGAVFQASVWVEHSILVSFQTTRTSTSKVGAFSISWTSVSSGNKSILDGKMMIVVLSCVSAAGAVLAACCFYFVCCGRRRRAGGVVVDGEEGGRRGVQLVRVPSEVRELLPSKPYQAPEANPLPGAETEPDCCSICLVELEQGEQVTVLPCMHFYHKDCIGSWLKRNCTCPLCKNNVLEAFKVQQYEARQARRNRRRQAAAAAAAAAPGAVEGAGSDGNLTPRSNGSGSSGTPTRESWVAAVHVQQQVEMTAVHSAGGAAGQGVSRSPSPWLPLEGFPPLSPAAAALPGSSEGEDAVVTLTLQPAGAGLGRAGRLPPLPQLSPGSGTSGMQPSASGSTTVAVPPLLIPPSPSPSVLSLQSGTVLATPEDFAPAAAAAAAVLAGTASRQRSMSPSGLADAASSAAQVSVAALRTSSRTLGRRLQAMLSPPSVVAGDSGMHGGSSSSSSPQAATAGPLSAPRVAVSIYAYAGSPSGGEDGDVGTPQQQQEGSSPHHAITVLSLPGTVDGNGQAQSPQAQQ